jgi:hypothetical protein
VAPVAGAEHYLRLPRPHPTCTGFYMWCTGLYLATTGIPAWYLLAWEVVSRGKWRSESAPSADQRGPRPVVGFDDALEVGQEGSITATMWVVGASELSGDASLAAPLGQEEELALGVIRASQIRAPTSRVGEPDAIKGLQPQST